MTPVNLWIDGWSFSTAGAPLTVSLRLPPAKQAKSVSP